VLNPTTPTLDVVHETLVEIRPVAEPVVLRTIPGVRVRGDAVQLPENVWGLERVQQFGRECRITLPRPRSVHSETLSPLLHDYQAYGVDYLRSKGGAILADQLGLGKTRTAAFAAAAVQRGTDRPVLIIGPKYLRSTWREELLEIGLIDEDEGFHALEGLRLEPDRWQPARFYFCHYDVLQTWWQWLYPMKPVAVIIDEAHFLKNVRTKRSEAAWLAAASAPYRFLLTGTPMTDRPADVWNLLSLATGRGTWGWLNQFRQRYAGATWNGYGYQDALVPTHTEEFRQRIETCYLRRTYEDAGLELPTLNRQIIEVDLDAEQRRHYRSLFEGYDVDRIVVALLEGRAGRKSLSLLNQARKVTSRAKLPTTKAILEGALAEGVDVVCFSWEREIARRLTLVGGRLIHGGLSSRKRSAAVQELWQSGGLLSATYGALSVGVNLQCASLVVLHALDWTPSSMIQAEGRVWRQGQTRPVTSRWVVATGTLDALLTRHVLQKGRQIEALLGDPQAAGLGELLSMDDRISLAEELEELLAQWRRW